MKLEAIHVLLIVAAFLSVLLRRYQPELSLGIGIAAGALVLFVLVRNLTPTFQSLQGMLDDSGLPSVYVGILFRALGICLLTGLASDTCKDAGEQALAAKAELVGKVMLLVLAMPLFEELTEMALSMMRGEI